MKMLGDSHLKKCTKIAIYIDYLDVKITFDETVCEIWRKKM